jgi:hypothetical protein
MSLTDINIDDQIKLDKFRCERFLGFFTTSLPYCQIQIDTDTALAIHCTNSEIVDNLIDDFEDLCCHAWLILGVRSIALYFCQEEIVHTNIY